MLNLFSSLVIPQLASLDNLIYLGILNGLNPLSDSVLDPCQKLEVLQFHLLPSLSHDLSSGMVDKSCLTEIDKKENNYLRFITKPPGIAVVNLTFLR